MFNCPSQIWGKIHQCSFWSWENVTLLRCKPVWKAKLNKTCFTWPISMVGSPASPHFAYLWTSSVKGSLVKAGWYGVFLCLGSHWQKRSSWKQERLSVMSLETPGTWWALTKELCFIESSTRNLGGSIVQGVFEWPELIMATTNSLSHQNWIRLPEKCGNQSVHATTITKSSCHSMLIPLVGLNRMLGSHFPWNYRLIK